MKKYIGTKAVSAKPMTRGEYNKYREWELPSNEDPADKGYLIEYEDGGKPNDPRHKGYISWSPEDVFIKAYRPVDGLTFGQALEALKAGKKLTRKGWNGKGKYIWLKPASTIKAEWCRDPMLIDAIKANGGEILALGSICMFTCNASGNRAVLTGWLASQSDLLLEDWEILD
jgi:hypothetical protein